MQWLNYLQCLPSYRNSLTVLCIRNYCALIMWIIHMVSWTWKTILLSNHVHCFCESTMDDITRVCLLMKFQLLLEALQEMLTGRWQTDTHTHKSCCTVLFTGSPPRPIFSAYIIILFTEVCILVIRLERVAWFQTLLCWVNTPVLPSPALLCTFKTNHIFAFSPQLM